MQHRQTNTHLLPRSQSFAPHPQDTYCIRERRQCSLVVTAGRGDGDKNTQKKTAGRGEGQRAPSVRNNECEKRRAGGADRARTCIIKKGGHVDICGVKQVI